MGLLITAEGKGSMGVEASSEKKKHYKKSRPFKSGAKGLGIFWESGEGRGGSTRRRNYKESGKNRNLVKTKVDTKIETAWAKRASDQKWEGRICLRRGTTPMIQITGGLVTKMGSRKSIDQETEREEKSGTKGPCESADSVKVSPCEGGEKKKKGPKNEGGKRQPVDKEEEMTKEEREIEGKRKIAKTANPESKKPRVLLQETQCDQQLHRSPFQKRTKKPIQRNSWGKNKSARELRTITSAA